MTCEWCGESIVLLDAQTSNGLEHWHTRCWNESAEERRLHIEEMDELEGFTPRNADARFRSSSQCAESPAGGGIAVGGPK